MEHLKDDNLAKITSAVKILYKPNDIIEVRAWDKQHNVFTGRYKYSVNLIRIIKMFDDEGCDVYYVLNPVGDAMGLRVMAKGGLCTEEGNIPHRRSFLLDFDPVRTDPIATDKQFATTFKVASEAKAWLESEYGWYGITLASSGNGCHLDVPCDLPNDVPSKELVRKAQRAISKKFTTAEVEVECFPDANRLVRAYGTSNKKGTDNELLHRPSGILVKPTGKCDPTDCIKRFVAANPVADPKVTVHTEGEGEGPFSRDLLFARLEAWSLNWENDDDEPFEFEETDRRGGFRIRCPGSYSEGWPDGEIHSEVSDSLNDSAIVWVGDGWPRFRCAHNHCGEGSEHGKKTWKDLQEFYDPGRKFHKIIEEVNLTSFDIDYADTGRIVPEATAEEVEAAITIQYEEPPFPNQPEPTPEPEPQTQPEQSTPKAETEEPKTSIVPRLYFMSEKCMYGWLGNKARELGTPIGWAYPAMLTAFAATITPIAGPIRGTLYTCLIGPVHSGKSETIKRAVESIWWEDPETVNWTVPGSDRGLLKIFQPPEPPENAKDGWQAPVLPRLLAQDELRNTLAKAGITSSSLPATLCSLWSMNNAGAADKQGIHQIRVVLNILGGLKADDPDDFAEVFNKGTTAGLFDRFLFGIAADGWKWSEWKCNPVIRAATNPKLTQEVFQMMTAWRDTDLKNRARLAEIAMRVAYIQSAANHDHEITKESMACALQLVEWQQVIRGTYKASLGDTQDSQATNAIIDVLEKMHEDKWLRWRDIASKKSWYRKYGAGTLNRVREALVRSGMMMEESVGEGDNRRKTGLIRLRKDEDDV